jgi:CheY-like chemotaxis protein
MPIMDGFTAISEMRKLGLTTTIIALSGKVISQEETLFFKQHHVVETLAKPVSVLQVQTVLTHCGII